MKNALVLDAGHNMERLDVCLEGEKILSVGAPRDDIRAEEEIDLRGHTLLPGIIDCHVHVAVEDGRFIDDNLAAWAESGVSTVRDCGMFSTLPLEDYMAFLRQKDRPGFARVISAGKYIDVRGGYGWGFGEDHVMGLTIETPEEAARAVTYQHAQGIGCVKIGLADTEDFGKGKPMLNREQIRAVCESAHRCGLRVTVHLLDPASAALVMECGADEAGHTPSSSMPEELLATMAERKMAMISTVGPADAVPHLPPRLHGRELTAEDWRRLEEEKQRQRAAMIDNLARFHRLGGIIGMGTDTMRCRDYRAQCRIPVYELNNLREAGLSRQQVIACASRNAAWICGIAGQEGEIAPGQRANLVAVPGSLESFEALGDPALVIQRGAVLRKKL